MPKTIAELATAIDERGASLTIQQDEDSFVCWIFDPVSPTIMFVNDDESLEACIQGCLEAWDAEAAEGEAEGEAEVE